MQPQSFHSLCVAPSPPGTSPCFRLLNDWSSFGPFRFHGCHSNLRLSSCSPIYPSDTSKPIVSALHPSSEGAMSAICLEDFHEKDWSFLESVEPDPEEYKRNIERIIGAGEITEASRVLVSIGSEGFFDRLVESSPCKLLLAVHDSLFVLACIKEKYDNVKCWQGELTSLPDKWSPLDSVFLYFLPALPFKLDQVISSLGKRCVPGSRLVISHPQGREALKLHRENFPEVIVSDLPDQVTLRRSAEKHSFEMVEFVDEPRFYLAVLKFRE